MYSFNLLVTSLPIASWKANSCSLLLYATFDNSVSGSFSFAVRCTVYKPICKESLWNVAVKGWRTWKIHWRRNPKHLDLAGKSGIAQCLLVRSIAFTTIGQTGGVLSGKWSWSNWKDIYIYDIYIYIWYICMIYIYIWYIYIYMYDIYMINIYIWYIYIYMYDIYIYMIYIYDIYIYDIYIYDIYIYHIYIYYANINS